MRERGVSEVGSVRVQEGPLSWPDLQMDLDEYKREHGAYPDVLILDSADDMTPLGRKDAEWMQLKESYRYMRSKAQEWGIAIWTSGQLERGAVEKARVNLKNIGGAYAKAQLAHYVLAVGQSENERNAPDGPLLNIYVLKDSTHGTTGAWLQCRVEFGRGDNGYPGSSIRQAYDLPSVIHEMEYEGDESSEAV